MKPFPTIDSAGKYILCGAVASFVATEAAMVVANRETCSPYLRTPRLPSRPYTRLLRLTMIWEET